MDYSVTFARHFSRLEWLLLHDSGNIEEQKAALRAVTTVSRDGPVTLANEHWRLVVNGVPLPDALTGVQDLAAQLIGHAVKEIQVAKGAPPAELLGLARILALEPVPGDGGRSVEARVAAMKPKSIVARGTGIVSGPAPIPAAVPAGRAGSANVRALSGANRAVRLTDEHAAIAGRGELVLDSTSGAYLAFAAVKTPKKPLAELLEQIASTTSSALATRRLNELVTLAESGARDALPGRAADIFHAVVQREAELEDGDLRRAFTMAIRRMSKPTLLRAVAQLLPRRRDRLDDYLLVLARSGEDGAEAVIEQLTNAQSMSDRRIFFDALVKMQAGVPALIHMLGDARWYVVRNAADLLGELHVTEADASLAELVRHDDERVRRAVVTALAKLTSSRAITALHVALRDSSAQVRMHAAIGLGGRKAQRAAGTLIKALNDEPDQDAQVAMLEALGRLATPDAVQRLIQAAEPEGRLFRKKSSAHRVAAVRALGEAKSPEALAALKDLIADKDRNVRDEVALIAAEKA